MKKFLYTIVAIFCVSATMYAQFPQVQNWRASDKNGVNVFENPKDEGTRFDGIKLRIGGGFTQSYQALTHSNTISNSFDTTWSAAQKAAVTLKSMTPGFNTAEANMLFDVQLEDGVRLNLTTYLSSRHHNESWVKGGYIQFDKLSFLGTDALDEIMKYLTIRVGHMEINYGDAHFRRSDGGLTVYNPFIESYICDAYTTEIGGDVLFRSGGLLAMVGATSGAIKGSVDQVTSTTADKDTSKAPAILAKLGYDTKLGDNGRLRVTGSLYTVSSSQSNTLYGGDRTGSNYFFVMENTAATTTANAFSGRVNPGFSDKVTAIMFNAFFKMSGLEFFGTFETTSGRSALDSNDRKFSQIAADVIYRFGAKENVYVAARYNSVNGNMINTNANDKQTINRIVFAAGWWLTNNILLKGEFVSQTYDGYLVNKNLPTSSILVGGKFSGVVMHACVGF